MGWLVRSASRLCGPVALLSGIYPDRVDQREPFILYYPTFCFRPRESNLTRRSGIRTQIIRTLFSAQQILAKFQYFPIKCKVLRAMENRKRYEEDLEKRRDFWGDRDIKLKASARPAPLRFLLKRAQWRPCASCFVQFAALKGSALCH
jgi:hypothetical protein